MLNSVLLSHWKIFYLFSFWNYREKASKLTATFCRRALNLEQSWGTGVKYLVLLLSVTMSLKNWVCQNSVCFYSSFQLVPSYTLLVEVRDMAGQPFGLCTTGTAVIKIEDTNDNAPSFKQLQVSLYIWNVCKKVKKKKDYFYPLSNFLMGCPSNMKPNALRQLMPI